MINLQQRIEQAIERATGITITDTHRYILSGISVAFMVWCIWTAPGGCR